MVATASPGWLNVTPVAELITATFSGKLVNMNANSSGEARRSWLSRWNILVLVAVVCLFFCLAIPAILAARDAARRDSCAHTLLQLGMGLHNYHDVHKSFPLAFIAGEDGRPWHSWRVMVEPFLGCDLFYETYDLREPWNSPANLKSIEEGPAPYYRCYADPSSVGITNYLAVMGEATAWPGPKPSHIQDFSKGMSHSIMLVERANSGICWGEPRDIRFDKLNLIIYVPSYFGFSSPPAISAQTISSMHRSGANVMFADGSVEFLPVDTSPELLEDMLVIGGDKPKTPLGPRKRRHMVYDPKLHARGMKSTGYKPESYIMDETSEADR